MEKFSCFLGKARYTIRKRLLKRRRERNMKTKNAFTLTELLVTVVVLGILAAAVIPWIYKTVEQRKTSEAEEMLAFFRTEQEKRCVLNKHYETDFAALPGVLNTGESKYFIYTLLPTGAEAQRKGGYGYTLRMPSYEDGRLCCEDAASCQRLGKNYPSCTDLTARADFHSGEECSPAKKIALCPGPDSRPCGCQEKGVQTRTCDPATDTWSDWGECSIPLTCDCSAVSGPRPAPQEQPCPQGGTQSRGFSCDTLTGQWIADPWGDCKQKSIPAAVPDIAPAEDVSQAEADSAAGSAATPAPAGEGISPSLMANEGNAAGENVTSVAVAPAAGSAAPADVAADPISMGNEVHSSAAPAEPAAALQPEITAR